jgi:uncharacterized protein YjiS (DUF1127 family)
MMGKTIQLGEFEAHPAFDGTANAPAGASGAGRGKRLLAGSVRVLNAALERRRHRRAMRELHALDDRMLRDIGIDRAAIPRAARFGRENG